MTVLDTIRGLLGRTTIANMDTLLSPEKQKFLRAAADFDKARIDRYKLYEDYYDGEQRTRVLDRAKTYLEASGLRFCENFSETVVDVAAERMEVIGFKVEGDEQTAKPADGSKPADPKETVSDWLTHTLLGRGGMDETQGIVHTNTFMKGDGYLILEPTANGLPRACWNRPEIIKPVYDDEGDELLYVVKKWPTSKVAPTNPAGDTIWRMNLYYPDRVEKWFAVDSDGENWAPHVDYDDFDTVEQVDPATNETTSALRSTWPIPWTMDGTPDGEPIGVQVIHFRNRPKGRKFGRSELKGVIPQQDALNKTILDLFYVSDLQAWAQRWASGTGDVESLKTAIGEWLVLKDPNAKVGQLDPSDPAGVLAIIAAQLQRISARSRTPLHDLVITTTPPSGESRKVAESGLTHKLEDSQTSYGSSWVRFAKIGYRIAKAYAPDAIPDLDPDAEIEVIWESVESRDELAEASTYEAHKRLGVSQKTIMRKLGYDPDEEAEQRAEEAEASMEAQAKVFAAGAGAGFGGGPPPPKPPVPTPGQGA